MSLSEIFNLIVAILSFILALISVVTVILTLKQNGQILKQNNQMIESSTRPYIVVSGQTVNFQSPEFMLVIKNYGTSGATITNLNFDIPLKPYMYGIENEPFEFISMTTLAPSQNIVCNLNPQKMGNDNIEIIKCNVVYTANNKIYKEEFIINFKALCKNIVTKASTENKELKIISYALQEQIKKNL